MASKRKLSKEFAEADLEFCLLASKLDELCTGVCSGSTLDRSEDKMELLVSKYD